VTLVQVEENSDSPFTNFQIRFNKFMNNFLVANNLSTLPSPVYSIWNPWNGGWNPWNVRWNPWNVRWIPWLSDGFHGFSRWIPYHFEVDSISVPDGFHTISRVESIWNPCN
jgi:hypothetical protein